MSASTEAQNLNNAADDLRRIAQQLQAGAIGKEDAASRIFALAGDIEDATRKLKREADG